MTPGVFEPRKKGSKQVVTIPVASGKIPHQVGRGTEKPKDYIKPLIRNGKN